MSTAEKKGAFSGVNDMLASGVGFDNFLTSDSGYQSMDIRLDDIEIVVQVRPDDELEDEEQKLEDLGKSLRKHQLQNIIVRPNPKLEQDPTARPYELVIGGRRVASGKLEGLETLRGECRDLTDEEVESVQFAENIHRKNLSAQSEAKRVQKTVDEIGVEATLEKYNKNKSWLSKLLSMLTLPPEANRLVEEKISADPEVINSVKQIEKINPAVAKEVVDKLKDGKGTVNQRKEVKKAKDSVKPPKAKAPATASKPANPANVATPADLTHQAHGPVLDVPPATLANDPALKALQDEFAAGAKELDDESFDVPPDELENGAKELGGESPDTDPVERLDTGKVPALPPVEALDEVFVNIFEFGSDPKMMLSLMGPEERDNVENWLHSFYDAGVDAVNLASAVLQGFRTRQFAEEGHGAFALVAFLSGGEEGKKFNLLDILGCIKKA